MKKVLLTILVSLLFVAGSAYSQVDFDASVVMPVATGLSISVSTILSGNTPLDPATHDWDTYGSETYLDGAAPSLDFTVGGAEPMELNDDGIFLTGVYFAIDIAPVGGSWGSTSSIDFSWTSGGNDLADHAYANVFEAVWNPPIASVPQPPTENSIGVYRLDSISGGSLGYASFSGGWPRIYMGLSDGAPGEPAGVSPFTSSEAAGTYSGTLLVSYTAI